MNKIFCLAVILTAVPSSSFARQYCDEVKECRGMLPQMCVVCKNGKTGGCAHWSCVKHKCIIAKCDVVPKESTLKKDDNMKSN
jgi:hypothetical protein